ncbi:MAG: UDP-N-acetylglucosamine 2-epimerase, partial [Vicinamibacterales bacterium]
SGAPGHDALRGVVPTPADRLAARVGIPVGPATLLVTYHPETRRGERGTLVDLDTLLGELARVPGPVLFTAPNADTGRDAVAGRIAAFVAAAPARRALVANLGHQDYLSAMAHVGAMVGNSSSGLIEAPSFRLPVVNVGDRQRGRVRARNVIDVPARAAAIRRGIRTALDPAFRRSLRRLANPYGRGAAGAAIARVLAATPLDQRLLVKRFVDL